MHTYYISPKKLQNPAFDIELPRSGRAGSAQAKLEAERVLKCRQH